MPYISPKDRVGLSDNLDSIAPKTVGELNFCITRMILEYLTWSVKIKNYDAWNSVIGVLECAKLEMYRRAVAPYEDSKIKQNGDVY